MNILNEQIVNVPWNRNWEFVQNVNTLMRQIQKHVSMLGAAMMKCLEFLFVINRELVIKIHFFDILIALYHKHK